MIAIIGLGNPGKEYSETRHNIGWRVIDALAQLEDFSSGEGRGVMLKEEKRFSAFVGKGKAHGEDVLLVKPTTYMNLSGRAVRAITDFYKLDVGDIWVVSDDLDLPLGWIRVRDKGSAGGHNGLQSVIEAMGTQEITRVRVGIAPFKAEDDPVDPKVMPEAEIYVLQKFTKREEPVVDEVIARVASIIDEGIKARRLDKDTVSIL